MKKILTKVSELLSRYCSDIPWHNDDCHGCMFAKCNRCPITRLTVKIDHWIYTY